MPFELLAVICFFTCIAGVIGIIGSFNPLNFSVKERIFGFSFYSLIPLSMFLWLNRTPYPNPTEKTYPIQPLLVEDAYISVVNGEYVNVNKATGCQVDPNKHLLKWSKIEGWKYGIYFNNTPTYSLVNKQLEK